MCFTYRCLLYRFPLLLIPSCTIGALLWCFSIPASIPPRFISERSLYLILSFSNDLYHTPWGKCLPPPPFYICTGSSHFRHSEMYRIVWESPEAPRDYLGKRICRSPPGPISPKRAIEKDLFYRLSTTVDRSPSTRHMQFLDRPIEVSFERTHTDGFYLCFLRIMTAIAPLRCTERVIGIIVVLIWPRVSEMCGESCLFSSV